MTLEDISQSRLHHRLEWALCISHGLDIGMRDRIKHIVLELVIRPNIDVGALVARSIDIIRGREDCE